MKANVVGSSLNPDSTRKCPDSRAGNGSGAGAKRRSAPRLLQVQGHTVSAEQGRLSGLSG